MRIFDGGLLAGDVIVRLFDESLCFFQLIFACADGFQIGFILPALEVISLKFYCAVVDGLFLGVFVGDIVADACQQVVPFFGDVIGSMGGGIEHLVPTWNLVENIFLDTADAFEQYSVCFCLGNMGITQ